MASVLPSHLYETYDSYKRGTAEVIAWLHQAVNKAEICKFVNKVREIEDLAATAVKKPVIVPLYILQSLKRTIRERVKVGKFFQGDVGPEQKNSNANHLYFTGVLIRVYESLYPLVNPDDVKAQQPNEVSTGVDHVVNIFELLDCAECTEDDGTNSVVYRETLKGRESKRPKKSIAKKSRDIISEYMDICRCLKEYDEMLELVRNTWEGVTTGKVPLPVASFITTMIFEKSLIPSYCFLEPHGIHDAKTLLARFESCQSSLNIAKSSESIHGLLAIRDVFQAVQDFKDAWKPDSDRIYKPYQNGQALYKVPFCFEDSLEQLFPITGPDESYPETCIRSQADLLLKRMGETIKLRNVKDVLTPYLIQILTMDQDTNKNKRYYDVSHFMLRFSFGIIFLLDSTSVCSSFAQHVKAAHLSAEPAVLALGELLPDCRLIARKVAQQIAKSTGEFNENLNGPCRCFTDGKVNIVHDIEICHSSAVEFEKAKVRDIYHKSPWVAGSIMVDQLEDAATSGLRAWHYRYHIGTLMHMYNCLIVLGYLNKSAIPVMEDLCNIFESNVFLGYKPRRKLWSCFQVWCGARLRPLGGMCHNKQRHNHNEFRNWALASVDDRYRGATNAARSFDIKKLSLLASLKQGLETDSDGILLALYSESKSEKDATKKDLRKAREVYCSQGTLARHLAVIKEKLIEEFTSHTSPLKLNYFKIYLACVDILLKITRDDHFIMGEDCAEDHICMNLPQIMFGAADRWLDENVSLTGQEHIVMASAAKTFTMFLGGKTMEDFMWKI